MRESRTYGSVRGAISNQRPYRVKFINLTTVKALGIEVPIGLVPRADELVEWRCSCESAGRGEADSNAAAR